MKKIFIIALLMLIGININAQYLGIKGLTIQATSALYVENNELMAVDINQVFAISFSDNMLTHIIYKDILINDSQIYKIENSSNFLDNNGNTSYKFETVSGLSGNRFYYEVKIDNSTGSLFSLIITQPDKVTSITYKGGIIFLKTYNQNLNFN